MRFVLRWRLVLLAGVSAGMLGCRDVLSVPVPAGLVDPSALTGAGGAEAERQGAIAAFANGFDVEYSGILSDEFTSYFVVQGSFLQPYLDIDARDVAASGLGAAPGTFPNTDLVYTSLQLARTQAGLAEVALARSASPESRADVGQMFGLVAYSELLLAEEFCSGVPLSNIVAGGGVKFGVPLTTDSLLARAVAAFDSALAYGVGSDTVLNVARVGLGRALLDRGQFAAAAAAVASVPTGFQYVVQLPAAHQGQTNANFYPSLAQTGLNGRFANVSDHEGGNGLNFVSAGDPRMPIDSGEGPTFEGTTFYYPAKFPFGSAPPLPLADWIEARLIQAEAALASGNIGEWATTLNALRADTADTHVAGLPSLTPDSTTGASAAERVDVMFRERAFWMFGTGRRLGDLRRLIRQYGRDPNAVFPAGLYPVVGGPPGSGNVQNYGTDVSFPIQAVEQANPNFHGCLSRGA